MGVLRRGKVPVLCADFMWGQFLLDGFDEDDIIAAQILQLEEVLAEADQLCPEDQPAQYIAVSSGGPPPTPFVREKGVAERGPKGHVQRYDSRTCSRCRRFDGHCCL